MTINNHQLAIYHFEPLSYSNGPGCRSVVWFQGCSLRCKGCYNPQTHPFTTDRLIRSIDVWLQIKSYLNHVEGITITGGEPFDQPQALCDLVQNVKKNSHLSTILYTGYKWNELCQIAEFSLIITNVDLLISGRYDHFPSNGNIGQIQPHKNYYFLTNRYNRYDLSTVPPAEVLISNSGDILLSGTNPIVW